MTNSVAPKLGSYHFGHYKPLIMILPEELLALDSNKATFHNDINNHISMKLVILK